MDYRNQRKIPRLNLNRDHDTGASAKGVNAEATHDADIALPGQETVVRGCRTRCPDWPRQMYAADTPRSVAVASRSPRGKLWNAVRVEIERAARPPLAEKVYR
jgi:hypothetical protein